MIEQLKKDLQELATPQKAKASEWFFKTDKGQYGEGDKFIGVTVPEQRLIAKKYKDLPLTKAEQLFKSPIHEERLVALIILVNQFKAAVKQNDSKIQKEIYEFYLANTGWVNNWDLVDSSAGYIVGPYLENRSKDILYKLAKSKNLWERRIAMVATSYFIAQGDPKDALKIAEILIDDKHDLIQKAVGWMLREVGKRCSEKDLTNFLDKHAATMPRTALRYSIEHFPEGKRQYYLKSVIK
ncbi:MAG: DNA alkylation repair protein [Candidatus Woykebacteria bacterium]